jgi:outer membrane protein insertion porin family
MGDEDWRFKFVLAFHSAITFLLPQFGNNMNITPRELIGLNGMNVARGWDPDYEYKALWENSLEIRHPLMKDVIWWTWLFDVAGVWPEIENMGRMTIDDFYFSFGAGMRINIAALPIRLYLCQTFKWEDGHLQWDKGDFQWGNLGLKFVFSFTQPGGF